MGYTHYWTFAPAITKKEYEPIYNESLNFLCFIMGEKGGNTILGNGYGDAGTTPEVNKDGIFYNGYESHETMFVSKTVKGAKGFHFCKTARKPYDSIVFANVLLMKYIGKDKVEISSDGVCFYKNIFDAEREVIDGIILFIEYLVYRNQLTVVNRESLIMFVNEILSWFPEYEKIQEDTTIDVDEEYLIEHQKIH